MKFKRITAFFLSIVMVIGVLPALALASEESNTDEDQAEVTFEEVSEAETKSENLAVKVPSSDSKTDNADDAKNTGLQLVPEDDETAIFMEDDKNKDPEPEDTIDIQVKDPDKETDENTEKAPDTETGKGASEETKTPEQPVSNDKTASNAESVSNKMLFNAYFPGSVHANPKAGVEFNNIPSKTVAYRVVDDGRHFYCYELSASDLNKYFFGHMSGSFRDTIYIKIEEGAQITLNGKKVPYNLGSLSLSSKKYKFIKYNENQSPVNKELSITNLHFSYTYKIEFGKGKTSYDTGVVFEELQGLDLTYNGKPQELINRSDLKKIDSNYTFFISKKPNASDLSYKNNFVPNQTDAGEYKYIYTVGVKDSDFKNHVVRSRGEHYSFTAKIEKAEALVKAPEAINMVYNGVYRKLVTPGVTCAGTILYSLEAEGKYERIIPRAAAAGTYKVYYKVDGDKNHNGAAGSVDVQIAKATPSFITTPKAKVLTYNGEDQLLLAGGTTRDGKILYSLDGVNYSEDIPSAKKTGTYEVYFKIEGDKNHTDLDPATLSVTIDPLMVSVEEVFTDTQKTTISFQAGEKFPKPVNPKIYGYDFAGWYTSESFDEAYDFDQEVGVNGLTIFAKWDKVSYDFTGDPATWTPDSGKDLVITVKRSSHDETTFDHFAGIEIDGQIVDGKNYKTARGSIVVTLNKDYLKTLSTGDHTVKVLFDDNDAISTSLTVKEAQAPKGSDKDSAQTGEHASVLLLITAVVLLIAGTITGLIAKKSKKN